MTKGIHDPKWALIFDFHTMPACPDVGANFDADAFTDRVKACGADFLTLPARCNLGMAYYDTRVGIRHPSLQYDLVALLAEACEQKQIAFAVYINVGLSHDEGLRHRDWTVLSPDGYSYLPDRLDHFFRRMCYNTPYGPHVLQMVRELAEGYPIRGFFLDCMNTAPCVGVECIREMKQRGIDWNDADQCRRFAHFSTLRMAKRIAETARGINQDLTLYFNGVDFEDQLDIGTYLEHECLPTGGWGYESLPLYARYARNLGKPVMNQTGRFHKSWGDFGGIRTEASLEYDCRYGLANAMRTTIGGHMHPRGDLDHAVFDLMERIYGRLQKLDPWTDGAAPLTEVAVAAPLGFRSLDGDAHGRSMRILKGAARMLCELKVQFDVLSDIMPWEGYKLLVLPDHRSLDEQAATKVHQHLDAGGAVLSTGWSGLDPEHRDFVFPQWGLKFRGDDTHDPAYYGVEAALSDGIPHMPHNFYAPGANIEALRGTQVLARIIAPYYNRHWDGEHGFVYLPPDKKTEQAAVTLNGRVAHVSHAVFEAYHDSAPVPLKQVIANLLKMLLPDPLVRAPGLPSFARVTVTNQPQRRIVHMLSYVPERRGPNTDMIEEPIELRDVAVALRADGREPKRVYLVPGEEELPFEVSDGYVQATVPSMPGHVVVVFEQ